MNVMFSMICSSLVLQESDYGSLSFDDLIMKLFGFHKSGVLNLSILIFYPFRFSLAQSSVLNSYW